MITTAQDATTYLTDLLAEATADGVTVSDVHATRGRTGFTEFIGNVTITLDRIARHATFPDWPSTEVMTKAVRQELRRTFRRYMLPADLFPAVEGYVIRAV